MIHHSKLPGKVLKKMADITDLIEGGYFEPALDAIENLPEVAQNHWDILLLKAYVLSQLFQYEAAFLISARLFEHKPNNALVAYNYALTCAQLDFTVLAFRTAATVKVEKLEPELAETVKEFKDELAKEYQKVREEMYSAVPQSVQEEVMLLHDLTRKNIYFENIDEAVRVLRQLLSLAPEFLPAINNLAEVMFIQGEFEEAVRLNERALKCDPTNTFSLFCKTRLDLLLGRPLGEYPLKQQLNEEDPVAHLHGLALHGEFETVLKLADSSRDAIFPRSEEEDDDGDGDDQQMTLAEIVIFANGLVSEDIQKRYESLLKTVTELITANGFVVEAFDGILDIDRFFPYGLRDKISDFAVEHETGSLTEAINEKFPMLTNAIQIGLRFGDWSAVETGLGFCEWAWSSEVEEALHTFASSKRSDFESRLEAALLVKNHNPQSNVQVWNGSELVDPESETTGNFSQPANFF